MRVQVSTIGARNFAGQVGTVTQTYGDREYLAVEVRFDSGGCGLFWHYQLEDATVENCG